jgi:hypothetical protein
MYEMYPDAWAVNGDRRSSGVGEVPRRRARKEHSVVPAVIRQAQTSAVGRAAPSA